MKEKLKKSAKAEPKTVKSKNIHDGHRDRMRKRFSETGFKGMHEHEILELLLYYSVPRRDTNPLAHRLIDTFGSLSGVLEASEDRLMAVDGVTMNSVTLIRMILPLFHEYCKSSELGQRLDTPEKTVEFLINYYSGILNERVMAICLDASCKVLCFEQVCEGDSASCVVNCRRLIEIALMHPMTVGIILAHNHPNGVALPSRDDVISTNEIIKMLANVNIRLLDHVIIAGKGHVCMASSAQFVNLFKQSNN